MLTGWREMQGDPRKRIAAIERKQNKLRGELTLAQMDRHATELEELDV